MLEEIEPHEDLKKTEIKKTNLFPEIISNSPLENTNFILSIPVKAEWKNGRVLRMLNAMFSQKQNNESCFEVNLIVNVGNTLHHLFTPIRSEPYYQADEKGNFILKKEEDLKTDDEREAFKLLEETENLISFLKQIIEIQKFSRILIGQPSNSEAKSKISKILQSSQGALERIVLEKAMKKSKDVSILVADASKTTFEKSVYEDASIYTFRTFGADIASIRFKNNKNNPVLGMFDADTVFGDNRSVKELQALFSEHSNLNYVFSGMTYLPAGTNEELFSDSPRENIDRSNYYNGGESYGSPQIFFRLSAYKKLQEICGWTLPLFHGDEDRDTSRRLIYHFGSLQRGLLLESSLNDLFSPIVMTSDRTDGFVDSASRMERLKENGVESICEDLGGFFSFRKKVMRLIEKLSAEKKKEALAVLEKSRKHFEKKQQTQRRFNRFLLNQFISAVKDKTVTFEKENSHITINEDKLLSKVGGEALLDYLTNNKQFVKDFLFDENNILYCEYLLGDRQNISVEISNLTPVQQAIREYVGEVYKVEKIESDGIISRNLVKNNQEKIKVNDLRGISSKYSLLHSFLFEILALGNTYKVLFEENEFLSSLDEASGGYWPKNPNEQEIPFHFGEQSSRLSLIRKKIGQVLVPELPKKITKLSLLNLKFKSFPIWRLFKFFKKKF